MKVLFISPKDPDKPGKLKFLVGGENTFTQSLLANPPSGVKYIHHTQALEEGRIVSRGWQGVFYRSLMKARFLPPDVGIWSFEMKEKFDLVHCHAYSLRIAPPPKAPSDLPARLPSGTADKAGVGEIPVVLSDSSSNFLFLRDYLGWSERRINLSYKIRGLVSKNLDIYDPNLNFHKAKKLIVWSNFAKKIHEQLGAESKKITVIPPGIEKLPVKKKKHQGFNILFIGIWFKRKGGPLLLEAYRILKKKYPEIKLTLIGQVPKGERLPKDIWHQDYLPREKLIKDIFPQADVLVLVPPKAEGYGLVVNEAASLGIPAIVSSVYALPELVEDKETGFIIPPYGLNALIERLERLIKDKSLAEKMGEMAQKRFEKEFWIKETNKKLLEVYKEAVK